MKYYLFLDESGDHGLNRIDPGFPVFVLSGVIMSHDNYTLIRNTINETKNKFWGAKSVILHSRDIRKCQNEFEILFDEKIKQSFYGDINSIVENSDYEIICAAIKKEDYIKKYGRVGNNVYEVGLSFILERAVFFLDSVDRGNTELHLVIEKRGRREDALLSEYLQKVISRGTFFVNSGRFKYYKTQFTFLDKRKNINGLQLADLVAYPIARHVIDPKRANPSFDRLERKFYSRGNRKYGLKIFP